MNDREIIARKKPGTSSLTFFAVPNLLFGLNFGVLGGMTNAFLGVPFFGSVTLYFGQFFVLLCLTVRGINSAIFAVAISSLVTAISANEPYLIIIFALEVLVVHALLHRGFFLFQAVVYYWIILGAPLLLTLTALTSGAEHDVLFVNGATRALNALMYVTAAALFHWFLPTKLSRNHYQNPPPKLASMIFSLCLLTVTLPALLIALIFINQAANQTEQVVAQKMQANVFEISANINNLLNQNISNLHTVANLISLNKNQNALQLGLLVAKSNLQMIERTSIYNKDGVLILTSKPYTMKNVHGYYSAKDKEFFNHTRSSKDVYISDASFNKDFEDTPIITINIPINSGNEFEGLVQGTIKLTELDDLIDNIVDKEFSYVITDTRNRTIASSMIDNTLLVSNFDFEQTEHDLINSISTILYKNVSYLLEQTTTKGDWTVSVLSDPKLVTTPLIRHFYFLLLFACLLILAFSVVAKHLAKKITRPLEEIAEHYPNTKVHPQIIEDSKVSDEIVKLTNTLVSSHAVMNDFQQQLKEQVDNKTRQLKQLNKELYSLAQKDGLTQLLNRSGFNRFAITSYRNCIRNHLPMSMILVDIDHFKKINDSYGHPFGDKCITTVAKILQKHCKRDTDIIGRFGGEEFILMVVGGEISEHHTRVKLITDTIRSIELNHKNQIVKMTVSAGICSIVEDFTSDFDALIKYADEQLYLSKRTGRDKTSILVR